MDSRVTADTGDGTKDSKVESKAAVRKGDMMAYDGRFGQRSYDLMGGGRRRCVLASTRRLYVWERFGSDIERDYK